MRKWVCVLSSMLIIGLVIGCGLGESHPDKNVEDFANTYFQSIQNKDYTKAASMFSTEDTGQTSTEEFLLKLQNIYDKLGDLESFKLEGWRETHYEDHLTGQNVFTYDLQYTVVCSNDSDFQTLTIYQTPEGVLKIGELEYNQK